MRRGVVRATERSAVASSVLRAVRPPLRLAVQYASSDTELPGRGSIRRWLAAAQSRPAQLTVRLVDAEEGRALNRDYRQRDYATNVLTFAYHDGEADIDGDIVLCAPVIRLEAATQGKLLSHHYAHLLIHGMLHLHGMDHQTEAEARQMESLERVILQRMRVPDPYAEAAEPHC